MTGQQHLTADGLVLLTSARDMDSAAASLSLAQAVLWDNPAGPPAGNFSVLGTEVATEYARLAGDLTDLMHQAPGHLYRLADRLRATAQMYLTADLVSDAYFSTVNGRW